MAAGRPTTYTPEMCDKVDKYLASCVSFYKDKELDMNVVDLPTIEGFSSYIDTALSTIYLWQNKHVEFSESLEKIKKEQKKMLINHGIAGNYNSTIAKLILSSNHGMSEKTEVDQTIKAEVDMNVSEVEKALDDVL